MADKSTEWTEFKESLGGSRNRNDKKLYSYLSGVLEDVIPYLEVLFSLFHNYNFCLFSLV